MSRGYIRGWPIDFRALTIEECSELALVLIQTAAKDGNWSRLPEQLTELRYVILARVFQGADIK